MPTDNLNSLTTIKRTAGLGAAGLLALATVLVHGGGPAAAAASDVRLAGVDCAADPEVVEVKNFGNTEQDLTGWKLESDGNDPFDLTPAGTIPAGGSIFIESGPGAQATFKWSQSQIFRDNDPADYAMLVDNTGATKGQTACAQATAAPTAAPTPTPTPAAGQVPNGGGPPMAPDGGLLSPAMLIYVGGSVIGAVVGLSVTWMGVGLGLEQRRKRRKGAEEDPEPEPPAAVAPDAASVVVSPPRAKRPHRRSAVSTQPLLVALIVALMAAVFVALLLQSQDSSGRR